MDYVSEIGVWETTRRELKNYLLGKELWGLIIFEIFIFATTGLWTREKVSIVENNFSIDTL